MIRDAIIAAAEKRDWNLLRLATESGVSYSTVHAFMKGGNITSANLEKLMDALKLKISRAR